LKCVCRKLDRRFILSYRRQSTQISNAQNWQIDKQNRGHWLWRCALIPTWGFSWGVLFRIPNMCVILTQELHLWCHCKGEFTLCSGLTSRNIVHCHLLVWKILSYSSYVWQWGISEMTWVYEMESCIATSLCFTVLFSGRNRERVSSEWKSRS
jgi:hypothetical protein